MFKNGLEHKHSLVAFNNVVKNPDQHVRNQHCKISSKLLGRRSILSHSSEVTRQEVRASSQKERQIGSDAWFSSVSY